MDDCALEMELAALHREMVRPLRCPQARPRDLNSSDPNTHATAGRELGDSSGLQKSLDQLRLSIKYVMFDLEATRRENAALRLLLTLAADGETETPEERR